MDKLTKKEMLIVKYIVAQNSLVKLQKELKGYRAVGHGPECVTVVLRYFSIPKRDDKYSIQYLNYCVENYSNINNGDYSKPIERAIKFRVEADAIETQTVYKTYTVHYVTIPSLKDDISERITEDFWDYDPESDIRDYGDTDINRIEYNDPEISDDDPFVIE